MGNSASEGLLAVRTSDVVAFMDIWSDMDPLSTGARLPGSPFLGSWTPSWGPRGGRGAAAGPQLPAFA